MLAVVTVSPSAQLGMGISQETHRVCPKHTKLTFLISCLSSSDLGLRPSLGDPPAGRGEGDGGEEEGTRPGAGVTCFPGGRRNLLPRWVFDPALCNAVGPDLGAPTLCTGSRGAGQCPTVSPAAGPPHQVALSNQECEAVPSTSEALHPGERLVAAPGVQGQPRNDCGAGAGNPRGQRWAAGTGDGACGARWSCGKELWKSLERSSSNHRSRLTRRTHRITDSLGWKRPLKPSLIQP